PMAAPPPPPEPAPAPPPPPPPEAAPPVPAGPLMVFFDFDRDAITPEARQILVQAADPSRQGTTVINLSGHTDRAGSQPYNQALGLSRARAVERELVSLGIDKSRISIQSFGEDRSLVDTVDGQREPQNRRVEIAIQPR
ncbi:OmpA family protein, partial [Sandarakinorhabdus oryzae]|uniref:OmpA family protein n=1 Tax=Sandarakinorhabdus oryzae TaxID=2675220 RepID=UPI0012E204DD